MFFWELQNLYKTEASKRIVKPGIIPSIYWCFGKANFYAAGKVKFQIIFISSESWNSLQLKLRNVVELILKLRNSVKIISLNLNPIVSVNKSYP